MNELHKHRSLASYLNNANNGVLSDFLFTKDKLISFLEGDILYTCHIDPNHSLKNLRYQLIISGNNVKSIDITMIGTGFLVVEKVSHEL